MKRSELKKYIEENIVEILDEIVTIDSPTKLTPQQQQTETVQESVKKVVEKYYKK